MMIWFEALVTLAWRLFVVTAVCSRLLHAPCCLRHLELHQSALDQTLASKKNGDWERALGFPNVTLVRKVASYRDVITGCMWCAGSLSHRRVAALCALAVCSIAGCGRSCDSSFPTKQAGAVMRLALLK